MNEIIDLSGLLPNFSAMPNWPPQTAERLSSLFVIALIAVSSIFMVVLVSRLFNACRKVSWLFKLLNNETSLTVVAKRQTLLEQATQKGADVGHLWREFDETLLEARLGSELHLHNTFDAHYFFNASTLASGLTESRMLAAVPGFLTAIGVIGTFVGLQLGLSALQIGNDVEVATMKAGLAHVISGASVAFMTSVWGVLLSVLFNFTEKVCEGYVRSKIWGLQRLIDRLFPRLSAEKQLQQISANSQESRESLQGLAEQIGVKMQESLSQVGATIQTGLENSLQKIMAPAIDRLVEQTTDGNQQALDSLMANFMNKFGEQGALQREAMDNASGRVGEVLAGLNTSFEAFVEKIETSQNEFRTQQGIAIQSIAEQVNLLVGELENQNQNTSEFLQKKLDSIGEQFEHREQAAGDRENQRSAVFVRQTTAMQASVEEMIKNIEQSLQAQVYTTGQIIKQGEDLQWSFEGLLKSNTEVSADMRQSATELKLSSRDVNAFGTNVRSAGEALAGAMTASIEASQRAISQNVTTSETIMKAQDAFKDQIERFGAIGVNVQELIRVAGSTFTGMKDHQKEYLAELQDNVEKLSSMMGHAITEYSKHANAHTAEHLNVWAKHTSTYDSQLTQSLRAIASLIDDIENKVRSAKSGVA